MKLLFDECVSRRLANDLAPHTIKTVRQMGWAGIKNGRLLSLAAAEFDAFITVDRGMQYQQNTAALPLRVFILKAVSNRLADLRALAPELLAALDSPDARRLIVVGPAKAPR